MKHCILYIALPLVITAQSAPVRPGFEVASVKPAADCGNGRLGSPPSPGRLNMQCATLRDLIRAAWDTFANGPNPQARRIPIQGGPGWVDSERYDIKASAAGGAFLVQMAGPMLQVLLEDRFNLAVHRETRELPVYLLTIAKTGLKQGAFKEVACVPQDLNRLGPPAPEQPAPNICDRVMMMKNGPNVAVDIYGTSMASLSEGVLSNRLDRPVIDKTGLIGRFDFHLEFLPDEHGTPADPVDGAGPSIFTAVQEQLGLKLSPAKGPVEVIVVDHAEKPSPN
jgi:uncharacterized protein (TIGR03435 family)